MHHNIFQECTIYERSSKCSSNLYSRCKQLLVSNYDYDQQRTGGEQKYHQIKQLLIWIMISTNKQTGGVGQKVDCYATRVPANPNLLMRRAGVDQRTIVCFHLYITTLYSLTIHTSQQCKILQVVHHNMVQYYNAISLLRDCYFSQSKPYACKFIHFKSDETAKPVVPIQFLGALHTPQGTKC